MEIYTSRYINLHRYIDIDIYMEYIESTIDSILGYLACTYKL